MLRPVGCLFREHQQTAVTCRNTAGAIRRGCAGFAEYAEVFKTVCLDGAY
jgi:hypothetical protein